MNQAMLIIAAQQEVLQSLLVDENPKMQSMNENMVNASINDHIAAKAKELGVDLDWSQTGRGIYGGKV